MLSFENVFEYLTCSIFVLIFIRIATYIIVDTFFEVVNNKSLEHYKNVSQEISEINIKLNHFYNTLKKNDAYLKNMEEVVDVIDAEKSNYDVW